MSMKCENCGAPYTEPISQYQKFVKCQYCGCVLRVNPNEAKSGEKRLIVREIVVETPRTFDINLFAAFLTKRGITSFDTVSGVLKVGSQQVCVSSEGAVIGPEPLKARAEKWVQIFMSES
jgi:hypothetical protein